MRPFWPLIAAGLLAPAMPAAAAAAPAAPAAAPALEQAVKASYLVKFAPFVDWPPAAMPPPGAPFTICLAGQDPFGALIDDVARGQTVRGRPVALRRIAAGGGTGGCHILYIGRPSAAGGVAPAAIAGQPVLTIGDSATGAAGCMIVFVVQAGRVRFQIDADAARANGIGVSSKLLGLAIGTPRK
jgi:hypothetical protein